MRRFAPKWLFKRSQQGRIPAEILARSKTGFGAPLREWMCGPLKQMCGNLRSRESLARRGLFDGEEVERLLKANTAGHIDASYTLFSVICIGEVVPETLRILV